MPKLLVGPGLKRWGKSGWPQWPPAFLVERSVRRNAPAPGDFALFTGAMSESRAVFPGQALSWDQIKALADCHGDELEELHRFNAETIAILETDPRSFEDGISIPKTLTFALMASHTEDLPFWISGLKSLIKKHGIDLVLTTNGDSYEERLVRAVAESMGVPCRRRKCAESAVLFATQRSIERLRFSFNLIRRIFDLFGSMSVRAIGRSPRVFFCLSRPRGMIYIAPVLRKLVGRTGLVLAEAEQSAWPKFLQEASPEEITGTVSPFRSAVRAVRLAGIWLRARKRIAALPHTYQGIRIAPHHIDFMREVWLNRGLVALAAAEISEVALQDASPGDAFVFIEPYDWVKVFAHRAKQRGMRRIFYYGIYNGLASSAAIWERSVAGDAEAYATINQWMADRLLAQKIASPTGTSVVGDVLQSAASGEDPSASRAELCHLLGLDPGKKIVLILSRAVSMALPKEQKEFYFREAAAAARRLGAQPVIKAHPYENVSVFRAEVAEWAAGAAAISSELPLTKIVNAADVMLNYPEGAATIDAVYARVPVIVFGATEMLERLDQQNSALSFTLHGAAQRIAFHEKLDPVLKELLYDEAKRKERLERAFSYARKFAGSTDGRAADRLAELILPS